MNVVRETKAGFVFALGKVEKESLLQILGLYPRVPESHSRVSRTGVLPQPEEMQRLLREALAEQRAENRKRLKQFLTDKERFKQSEKGWQLSVSSGELEWLLQILNDVRVGSWVSLGAPEPKLEIQTLNEKTLKDVWAMEMAGMFECALLEALRGRRERVRPEREPDVCAVKCLGTGDGWPSADRNHAAFLYRFGETRVLIDCGEGTSRTYKGSGLSYDALDAIFISHMHADHMGGFFMLMQGLWLEKRRKKLPVYMPRYAIAPLREMLTTVLLFEELFEFRLELNVLNERGKIPVGNVRVTPFRTSHLDSFRSRFGKTHGADFAAYCFLIEHKKLRVGHSADLGRPEDLDPLFERPLDLLVCELAHYSPQRILSYLKGKAVRRIAFVHIGEAYRKEIPSIRERAEKMIPGVEVCFPRDGEEVRS